MRKNQPERPLLESLQARISKLEGGIPRLTDVDIALHQQSLAAIAALQAEVTALKADKARLDSGMIMTWDRDDFGEMHQTERHGMNLRAAIDEAIGRSQQLNPA